MNTFRLKGYFVYHSLGLYPSCKCSHMHNIRFMSVALNCSIIDGDVECHHLDEDEQSTVEEAKLPLQLAIVGRPNVGKSTLLNAILQEDRVLVGPEAGLTRDSIRVQFEYEGRTVYLVSIITFSFCKVTFL